MELFQKYTFPVFFNKVYLASFNLPFVFWDCVTWDIQLTRKRGQQAQKGDPWESEERTKPQILGQGSYYF